MTLRYSALFKDLSRCPWGTNKQWAKEVKRRLESKWDSESGSNLHRQIYKVRQSFVKTTKEINSIDKRKTSRENKFWEYAKSELKRSGVQARLLTWQVDNQSGVGESLLICLFLWNQNDFSLFFRFIVWICFVSVFVFEFDFRADDGICRGWGAVRNALVATSRARSNSNVKRWCDLKDHNMTIKITMLMTMMMITKTDRARSNWNMKRWWNHLFTWEFSPKWSWYDNWN